jgi:hypothetical protein
MKGQALRRGPRRVRPVKSAETPVPSHWGQRQNDSTRLRSLATTSALSLCLTIKNPRQGRTLAPCFLRGLTVGHLEVESEPSWLATSSAMSSNPASGGSGGCSRRDRAKTRITSSRKAGASALCASLKDDGGTCFVLRRDLVALYPRNCSMHEAFEAPFRSAACGKWCAKREQAILAAS